MTATKISHAALGSVALRIAAPLLNLSISIALVRQAGVHEYGVYSYCLSVLAIILSPITASFSTLLVRHLAIHHARHEWPLLRGLLRRTVQWGAAVSLALLGLGLIFGNYFLRETPDLKIVFFAMLVLVPFIIFNEFRSATLRGLHHVVLGQFPEQIVVPVVTLFLVALVYVNVYATTALTLVGIQIIATLCALLIGSSLLRTRLPPEIQDVIPAYQDRMWFRSILPLLVLNGSQQCESEIVVMLLGQFDNVESSGIYRICLRGAVLIPFVLGALNIATAPTFSRLHALGNFTELSQLVVKLKRYALLAAVPVALPLIFFGDWVLQTFYGAEFIVGTKALTILCVAQILCVGAGPVGCLLSATGHERDNVKSSLIALTLTIMLSSLLIPRYGLIGAALASAISIVVRNAVNSWFVYRRFGIKTLIL